MKGRLAILASPTIEEVRHWAETLLLSCEDLDVSDDDSVAWGLRISPPHDDGLFVSVVHYIHGDADHISLAARVGLSDEHERALEKLSHRSLSLFLLDLQLAFFRLPIEFGMRNEINQDTGQIQQLIVDFAAQLVDEDASKRGLYETFLAFQTALGVFRAILNKMTVQETWP